MSLAISEDGFLGGIAAQHNHHGHDDPWWILSNQELIAQRLELESALRSGSLTLGSLGRVPMTYVEMGAITSVDLFGLDELILFSFYWVNRHQYRRVIDMGANVGLHSMILGILGAQVTAYEPDPVHTATLRRHLESAGIESKVQVHEAAVTPRGGATRFVRVVGNTTGSHVAGAKENPYGDLEYLEVQSVPVSNAITDADLIKMDVEGLEADLIAALNERDLRDVDVICEVGSRSNAEAIWRHFAGTSIRMYPQNLGWRRATSVADLPVSYHEGSLFLSARDRMPWNAEERK
jgi:FkbM family methyltransferase